MKKYIVKYKKVFLLTIAILLLFYIQTIAYSAINGTITIKGDAYARVEADVRITDFYINDTTNSAISMYENYTKNTINSFIKLTNNSSITYNIEIINYGNIDTGIYSIDGIPEGIYYSIENYELKEKMCNDLQQCNGYAVMNYKLKIYTNENSYEGTINLHFDFREFHKISYVGFDGTYITDVIDGDSISVSFNNENIDLAIVNSQSTVFSKYENKKLMLNNIIDDIEVVAIYNSKKEFTYTGTEQIYIAPYTGIYKLETWGAQGGNAGESIGGYGGYANGYVHLNAGEKLYINVGGLGGSSNTYNECTSGGYNGGGTTCSIHDAYFASGGGATHIATKSGLLSSLSESKQDVLIVSGGGGGAGYYNGIETEQIAINNGGSGGGVTGNNGTGLGFGHGASQNSIGKTHVGSVASYAAFGQGANGNVNGSSGGGAGYFGGGAGYAYGSSAGGGSSSISNQKIIKGYMTCYNCEVSTGVDTKTYTTNMVSEYPTENTPKTGNGYAKITYVNDINNDKLYISYLEYDNQNSTEKSYKINEINDLEINANIYLNNVNSKIYLKAKIKNTTEETFKYAGITNSIYSNNDIKYEIQNINIGNNIMPGEEKEIIIAFSFSNYTSNTVKNLECNLTFNFTVETYSREYDAIDEIRTLKIKYSGIYKLEVWGAQGGGVVNSKIGGAGGYSVGYIQLNKDDALNIVVGGKGKDAVNYDECQSGGYNGGGNSCSVVDAYFASGGGATHIATQNGLLSTLSNSIDSILIIAGGGGGAGLYTGTNDTYSNQRNGGGCGGGNKGANGVGSDVGVGGTQSSGGNGSIVSGSFGLGGSITVNGTAASGGGGGYYGGGTGFAYGSSAGGGSGYIGNNKLYNKYMVCYNCEANSTASIKTITNVQIIYKATADIPKEGNGYAKITLMELNN